MATAEELLARLANPATEPHIVIGVDRVIEVPDELKRIAVQFDHNIETVTFDCPRYWDGNDMSQMKIYINYKTPDNRVGSYHSEEVSIDTADTNIMHFTWTISKNVTSVKGNLSFLVCIKKTDSSGNEVNHWNSELNREMTISEGLECAETILDDYPDIITYLLTRMEELEALNGIGKETIILKLDDTLKKAGFAADAAVVGNELKKLEDAIADVRVDVVGYELDLVNTVTIRPSNTTLQTFNLTGIIDANVIRQAVTDRRTITISYNVEDDEFGGMINGHIGYTMLSHRRKYTVDGSEFVYHSGIIVNYKTGRYARIELCLDHDEVFLYYYPDPAGASTSGGDSGDSGGSSGGNNNNNIHTLTVGGVDDLANLDFSNYSPGDIILVVGLELE